MEGILDFIKSDLGKKIVSGVADSTGNDTDKTSSVLTMGLPLLMKGMERNASSTDGASSLFKALETKHDGSILDNLGSLFNGGVNEEVKQDGTNILNHILGAKQNGIMQVIGQKSGLDVSAVSNILKIAAPIVMGFLGKQKNAKGLSNSKDISNLIGGILGGSSTKNEQGFLEQILDSDGDGSVVDDVAGLLLDNTKKSGGVGGMLGGLFGK